MRFSTVAVALATATSVAAQTTFNVLVGANASLTFTPSELDSVKIGDTIAFTFLSKAHSLTQSSFALPCSNLSTDSTAFLDSGIMPVAANATEFPQWSFTLKNDSAPLWFYCRQVGHCSKGMVFAINPTAAKSFSLYQAAAEKTVATTDTNGLAPAGAVAAGTNNGGSTTGTTTSVSGAPAGGPVGGPVGTGTATTGAPSSTTSNGARALGASAAGLLTVAGVMALAL